MTSPGGRARKNLIFKIKLLKYIHMKKDVHPKYNDKAKVICACGNTFTVGSTKELIEVEICSKCHPFFTGKEKIIYTLGQVQKFKKRLAKKDQNKKGAK